MTIKDYFDIRVLAATSKDLRACPIVGCTATLSLVDGPKRGSRMPFCPDHRIRIHNRSQTFVYYDVDPGLKKDAALRNILFERDYFRHYILGNSAKAESHRISYETSEDALTWNVFARMAREGKLGAVLSTFTQKPITTEPELYLWGLKIDLASPCAPMIFPALLEARHKFEKGIRRFLTEPDIMLYVPGEVLVLIEAKFTSENTIASDRAGDDFNGEKPKSRAGLIERYSPDTLASRALVPPSSTGVFYSQLYRNLVFSIYMADRLNVEWGLVNLVSQTQCQPKQHKAGFQDPTPFLHGLLPKRDQHRFRWYSWEKLYRDHVVTDQELTDLAEYMYSKSAKGKRAFSV